MSESDPEAIKQAVRKYMYVFGALGVGTILTVLMAQVHFQYFAITVAIALLIAAVKAGLVAAFFMHLSHEKALIYRVLIPTVFFFIAMMALFVWSIKDLPTGSRFF